MALNQSRYCNATISASAGIGLRAQHYKNVLVSQPDVGWLEVHSENYFGLGGAPLHYLESIRADYPISLHGVGLSLGSVDALDKEHLNKLKGLIARIEPSLVSEHLSWSSFGGDYLNDLAPLPYTEEALSHCVERITQVQDYLGRCILIENPSSYLEYEYSKYRETEFINELARHTGCGILLDVNNVFVSCHNHGWNAQEYLQDIAAEQVQQIHLAGHSVNQVDGKAILIDTHNQQVCAEVWALYKATIQLMGSRPTLIEWDSDLPDLSDLVTEAQKADVISRSSHAKAA